jgi:hypothetical protein
MATAKKNRINDLLEQLDQLSDWQAAATQTLLKSALGERSNIVVARAARLCAQQLLYDLIPELLQAYQRFLGNDPLKYDKNCLAKTALIKALYELDYQEASFYREQLRYRQLEPVWGGKADTAADIRCTSAFGLAASVYPRAIFELIELFHDSEPAVRLAAVRAVALLEPFSAQIALRCKALQGDADSVVTGECLAALLRIEADDSLDFVAGFLQHANPELRELAALALGESRLAAAFECLRRYWLEHDMLGEFRTVLLRALALQRHDDALQFLLSLIENDVMFVASEAVKALAIYRHDDKIRQRVLHSIEQRKAAGVGADAVLEAFAREWNNDDVKHNETNHKPDG